MRISVIYGVAWSVCLSAGLSAMIVSPAKRAEPIELLFEVLCTRVGPRNHVFDGVQIPMTKIRVFISCIPGHLT